MFEALSHHRDPIEAKLQSKPSPGLRPPSPGGRGTKSLLPPGEGAAQRRMRAVSASATTTPHPAFGQADANLALTAKLADNASSRSCFSYRRATAGKTTSTIRISPFLPQSGPNACAQRNQTGSPETTSNTLSIATSHQPTLSPPVSPACTRAPSG